MEEARSPKSKSSLADTSIFNVHLVVGALLFYGSIAVILASALSEVLSLWALTSPSNNLTLLRFVFFSTFALLILMVVPAARTVFQSLSEVSGLDDTTFPGFERLRAADRDEQVRRSSPIPSASGRQPNLEQLNDKANQQFRTIAHSLREAIGKAAPLASSDNSTDIDWTICLNDAKLRLTSPKATEPNPWGPVWQPAFNVISFASISIIIPENRLGYRGRSHSLWYCDLQEPDVYKWYEIAFMPVDFWIAQINECPFSLDPGPLAAQAIGPAMAELQLARNPKGLNPKRTKRFIERWAGWLADGARGKLDWPSPMPEEQVVKIWRQN